MGKGVFLLIVVSCLLAISIPSPTVSQQPTSIPNAWMPSAPVSTSSANEAMIVTSNRIANGNTQMIVVHSQRQSIAVYEISNDSGTIQLKSVRNINADFMLDDFNGTDPSPEKVRTIIPNP